MYFDFTQNIINVRLWVQNPPSPLERQIYDGTKMDVTYCVKCFTELDATAGTADND